MVTHASGEWADATSYSGGITGYDYNTSQWDSYQMTLGLETHSATTTRNQRKLMSYSVGATSYWWDDRIVTTVGVRRDENKTRISGVAGLAEADRYVDGHFQSEVVLNNYGEWAELAGTTKTLGAVVKPFLHWDTIEKRVATGSLFWEFGREFGFSYNQSNTLDPPAETKTDFFGAPLPKATGEGRDFGVQFSLFKNKLFARVNWFKATNENAYANPGAAVSRIQTLIYINSFRVWANRIVLLNAATTAGMDPRTWDNSAGGANDGRDSFLTEADRLLSTTEREARISEIWGQNYRYYDNMFIGTTQSQEAKGVEVVVTYNPLPNWTMKFTAGKQKAVYHDVLKEFQAWYAHRNQVWENARAVDYLTDDSLATYTPFGADNPVVLNEFWNSYGYVGEYGVNNASGYRVARDYYDGIVTPEVTLARDLEGQLSPSQRKYRGSFVTTYNLTRGALKGLFVGGAQRWESKAIIGYHGKASGTLYNGIAKKDISDTTRPIYDNCNWYTDLWLGYNCKIFNDKVRIKLQLNVMDILQSGELQVVKVNLDGSPVAYRIIDPRQFILTATFDF